MSTARAMAGLLAEQVNALGLSQRQFADLVGTSTKHVNLVLNGKVTARVGTLDKWAEQLGCRFRVELED